MIEVKETIEPFVPPQEPEISNTSVEVMTVTQPAEVRSTTSAEEEEGEEDREYVSNDVKEYLEELPAFDEYRREMQGDSLTFGDM